MHQCLPDHHIYLSLVRLFSITLIKDLKIYLTCQNQFEILENSRHRWMRGACCKNIHWSLESLSMSFFRLRFNQQKVFSRFHLHQSILSPLFAPQRASPPHQSPPGRETIFDKQTPNTTHCWTRYTSTQPNTNLYISPKN